METTTTSYKKDYTLKIIDKLNDNYTKPEDINNMIIFLNYCFLNKNNFFVDNFNKKVIKNICLTYNQIKTNIFTPSITDVFYSIESDNVKLIRFIIINFINNYETIKPNNEELCSMITRDSLKHCLIKLNQVLKAA